MVFLFNLGFSITGHSAFVWIRLFKIYVAVKVNFNSRVIAVHPFGFQEAFDERLREVLHGSRFIDDGLNSCTLKP